MRNLPQKQSLVTQTLAVLKAELQSGAWARGLPAERKLCEQLMVSRGTLRAALACLKRERWVDARQGSRWRPVLRKGNRRVPGAGRNLVLLTPQPLHVLNPFSIYWIDHLRGHLGEAGYQLDVLHERGCYVRKPDHALEDLAQRLRPAGWVLSSAPAAMQQWFSERGMPCVITGSRHSGVAIPSVDRDLPAACRHAAGLFLARGFKRMVLLNPRSGLAGDIDCEKSFQAAASKSCSEDAAATIAHHDGTPEGIHRRLDALLKQRTSSTGFIVSGAKFTLAALGFLLRSGLHLPRDAALISRDDDSFLPYVVPTVARYSTDPTLFARKVSRAVLRLLHGGAVPPQDIRVMPTFISGETFG